MPKTSKKKAVSKPSGKSKTMPKKPVPKAKTVVSKPAKAAAKTEKSNGSARQQKVRVAPKHLSSEMLQIRSKLTTMLADLRKDIDHEVRGASERDLAHINDTSDMASDSAEGDLSLRIAESETVEASEIERAIEKIDTGTYGICETCNKVIGADRLQFLPYVTLCIKCQELAEIRKREDGDELDDLAEGTDDSENN